MIKTSFFALFTVFANLFFVKSTTRRSSSSSRSGRVSTSASANMDSSNIITIAVCSFVGFVLIFGLSIYCARRRQRLLFQKIQQTQSAAVVNQQSSNLNMQMAGINQAPFQSNDFQQQQQLNMQMAGMNQAPFQQNNFQQQQQVNMKMGEMIQASFQPNGYQQQQQLFTPQYQQGTLAQQFQVYQAPQGFPITQVYLPNETKL